MNGNPFDRIQIDYLLGDRNICGVNWGERDCRYLFNKFYYFLGGDGTLVVDGVEIHPRPGDLVFIPADTRHTYGHDPQNPVHKYWCHFDVQLDPMYRMTHTHAAFVCRPDSERFAAFFDQLLASRGGALVNGLWMKHALLGLFGLFLEAVPPGSVRFEGTDPFVDVVLPRIEESLTRNLSLKELADLVPMTPNHFIRCFRKSFGTTPIAYIQNRRLTLAQELLRHPDRLPIEQIAERCGFQDPRYFTRLFRRRFGLTPTACRNLR